MEQYIVNLGQIRFNSNRQHAITVNMTINVDMNSCTLPWLLNVLIDTNKQCVLDLQCIVPFYIFASGNFLTTSG
jgi:hypothetical protein